MLLTTALRFGVTGLAQLTASPAWEDAAGIVGLVLCAVALHAAAAMVLEDALGRHGGGRAATEGALDDVLAGVRHEAGVRRQL